MALFNHAIKQVTAKLVYFGPGLCGKTTNLQWVHGHVAFRLKGDLVSLKTKTDRTLFFDVLPVELAPIRGMRSRVQIYTVPGQVFYESTRRMVLKGADAVVFVADSQASMLDANAESLESLRRNLISNELDPNLPLVLQYNKRDLKTALPVDALNARLNPQGLPFFEAVAITGVGVEETLKKAMSLLFTSLTTLYDTQPAPTQPAIAPPAATAPAPAARPPAVRTRFTPPAPAPTPSRPAPSASRAAVVEPDRPPAPAEPAPPRIALGTDQWLYLRDGEQRGPISFDDLVDLVLGSIPEDTAVWGGATTRWTPANLVPEIAEQIPPPLPMRVAREEDFPDFKTVSPMLRTALIADEDSSFRQSLALPLAAQGFKIFEARDGAEAWRLATQHRPWVMLADLGMPEVDGFEFCRRVRANSLLSHRPLVFISGSDRYKDRYRALQLGADEFLSKQTPIRELLIRIQLLLTRYSDLESAPGKPAAGTEKTAVGGALQGQIEVFGAAGVLQICSQGMLTGIFSARAREAGGEEKIAVFGFREGQIITATAQELTGPEAVYSYLAWDRGQFKFVPGDPGQGAPFAQSVEHLLLEGCRRVDEARQGAQGGADE
jgi:CheY-like chemotaxis protein/signal recognition particle receptor subunit beta